MVSTFGRPLTLQAIRSVLDMVRAQYASLAALPDQDRLLEKTEEMLRAWTTPTLKPVINATGVILHTNLGRAPLSPAAVQAIQEVSLSYSTLEYELTSGKRGTRAVHSEDLLKHITGAEATLVVNNNAAAVLLVLTALARRRKVVIARSQLVEIGGGFRVPDVMAQSGAHLVEVGTTNRVHLADYGRAIQEQRVTLIMRAHRSNFQIIGFTSEPTLEELVTLSHRSGVSIVDDLGSGTLIDTSRFGLGHEPMIQESLAAGVDLVCFSGDKLLGGPQAGISLGKSELIEKLKKHPLARAIRADKLCLAALSATLLHYLKDEALDAILFGG
jgi:L-seryl-tRNA(Ser) seleniumtransferase